MIFILILLSFHFASLEGRPLTGNANVRNRFYIYIGDDSSGQYSPTSVASNMTGLMVYLDQSNGGVSEAADTWKLYLRTYNGTSSKRDEYVGALNGSPTGLNVVLDGTSVSFSLEGVTFSYGGMSNKTVVAGLDLTGQIADFELSFGAHNQGVNSLGVTEKTVVMLDGFSASVEMKSYAVWSAGWGADIGLETDDYDLDGLNNFSEYGLGGNPTDGKDTGLPASFSNSAGTMIYVHAQRNDDAVLSYWLETTESLVTPNWTNGGYTVVGTNRTGETFDYVTSSIPVTADQAFVRLRINSDAFTFVQFCDTQLGFGGYEHDIAALEQAVMQVNELNPDFVVVCGDLVDEMVEASIHDFKEEMGKLNMPYYCAPGNHDVGDEPTIETLQNYRDAFGEDYFSFVHKGCTFVFVNTSLWRVSIAGESEAHDAWVSQTVGDAAQAQSSVFIIQHYPLYLKDPAEADGYYNLPLSQRQELLVLYEQSNVLAVLAGHTHTTIINQYEGIQLVNGEVLSKNFDERPLGFRRWTVAGSTAWHEFVPLQSAE